ncbi:MAG: hypothetical protein ACYCO3_04020 [Mycobacteriales bacterium]
MHDDDETAGTPSGDTPLWALDFVVPDDLSELQAEVSSYRKELRRAKRQRRLARFGLDLPLRRHLVAPMLALILLVAAVAGSLLVTLDPRAAQNPAQRAPLAKTATPPGQVGGLLPDVRALGATGAVDLRGMRPALIALIPPLCRCTAVLDHLAGQADEAGLGVVIVAPPNGTAQLNGLLAAMHVGAPVGVVDATGALWRAYHPAGVTAILLAPDGRVPFQPVRDVTITTDLQPQLFDLVPLSS